MRRGIVIGAGASGLTAAIFAARKGAEVTVIEKTARAGKKLSMTGNGRCNLSNMDLEISMYNASAQERLTPFFERFGLSETLSFFESIGVTVQDEGGYLYPLSGQAVSVVDALLLECNRLGVSFIYGEQVKEITPDASHGFHVTTDKNAYDADFCIAALGARSGTKACGCTGDGYYLLEQLGLNASPQYPALVPLVSDDETLPFDSGVRAFATLTLQSARKEYCTEYGEMQLSKGSVSGIPALQASAFAAKALASNEDVEVSLDFFPGYSEEEFEELKSRTIARSEEDGMRDIPVIEFLTGFHNGYLNEMVLRKMKLSSSMKMRNLPASMLASILDRYRKVVIPVTGTGSYEKAQATAGGIKLDALDENLQAVSVNGLYVTGELVDVDGRCGGYNLQWAWTSGAIAGKAAGRGAA